MWILVVQSGVKKENIYEQINLALSTKQHGRQAEHMVAALERAYGKSGHRTPQKVITVLVAFIVPVVTVVVVVPVVIVVAAVV